MDDLSSLALERNVGAYTYLQKPTVLNKTMLGQALSNDVPPAAKNRQVSLATSTQLFYSVNQPFRTQVTTLGLPGGLFSGKNINILA